MLCMNAYCGVHVEPVTDGVTATFNAPKVPAVPLPVVSTVETAALLDMIVLTSAKLPPEGPTQSNPAANHTVEELVTSEIAR